MDFKLTVAIQTIGLSTSGNQNRTNGPQSCLNSMVIHSHRMIFARGKCSNLLASYVDRYVKDENSNLNIRHQRLEFIDTYSGIFSFLWPPSNP